GPLAVDEEVTFFEKSNPSEKVFKSLAICGFVTSSSVSSSTIHLPRWGRLTIPANSSINQNLKPTFTIG
ncbi:MAG: hypothetical protein IJY04_00960, partial [Clostridia bacterium]|nr:hypothetical protein [Clostridia bacterium]